MITGQTNKTLPDNSDGRIRRSFFSRFLKPAAFVFLLAAFLAFYSRTEPRFIWLSKAGFDSAIRGNLVVRAKRKLHFMNPASWERLFGNKPKVVLKTFTFDFAPEKLDEIFGPSISTNANGNRAWILSPDETNRLKTLLHAKGNPMNSFSDGIPVHSGMTLHLGNGVMIRPYISGNSIDIAGRIPTSPEFLTSVFYRMQAKNGEILIIADKTRSNADGKISLFVLIPTIVDSKGRPLK